KVKGYSSRIHPLFFLCQDAHEQRSSTQILPSSRMANGYILPAGRVTRNALFVGGMDMKVDENDIQDLFARFGSIKEVKLIRYAGGICKGYGFVYFNEDVNIQSVVEQQISLRGQKLRLGPAIMKARSALRMSPWMSSAQYFDCSCRSPMGGGMAQPSPVLSGGSPYNQPYPYSTFGGSMFPQMPMNYAHNAYAYLYTPPYWTADQRTWHINQVILHVLGI
uniref:Deleted in azoospermia-like n=1 Tax=Sphaeramia orbicularis TaxID=375764 RepID=A0A673BCR0_9TELE